MNFCSKKEAQYTYEKIYSQGTLKSSINRYALIASLCKGLILDVACGDGWLQTSNSKIIGLDFCRSALCKAKQKGAKHLILGDVHSLPFKSVTFDSLVSLGSLEHFTHQRVVLSEMKRVLKHDGYIILTVDTKETQKDPFLFKIVKSIGQTKRKISGRQINTGLRQPINKDLTLDQMRTLLYNVGLKPIVYGYLGTYRRRISILKRNFSSKEYPYELFTIAQKLSSPS